MTDPGVNDDERHAIADLMAQGVYAGVNLATPDLDRAFERLEVNGAEVVQEPIDQDYGISRLRGSGTLPAASFGSRSADEAQVRSPCCRQPACELLLWGTERQPPREELTT